MKTLTLENLEPYLAHGLKLKYIVKGAFGDPVTEIIDWDYKRDIMLPFMKKKYRVISVKPILRNLSQLTKPITHKGETFVPMLELAKISIPIINWSFDERGGIVSGFDSSILNDGSGNNGLNSNKHEYVFWWSIKSNSFHCNTVIGVPNQLALFKKLYEWHFALDIDPELYIDVDTLENNPY